jgi:dihydroneopterin aldolase
VGVVDCILLEGIQVPAALGVTAAERRMRRPVLLDIEVEREHLARASDPGLDLVEDE